jgi:hypothetical protein
MIPCGEEAVMAAIRFELLVWHLVGWPINELRLVWQGPARLCMVLGTCRRFLDLLQGCDAAGGVAMSPQDLVQAIAGKGRMHAPAATASGA